MGKSDSTFLAVGGGEFGEATEVVDALMKLLDEVRDPRIVVLTVATAEPESAIDKYNTLFRGRGIKHVESIDVSTRSDAFSEAATAKIRRADALFFTGGDQLNVTTLIGGTPVHEAISDCVNDGIVVVGTSAGAAMMSKWMIISGESDHPPAVGSVEIGPGMDLINGIIIDTHFSARGRHGRLLTAVAHYPQALGIGIDTDTAFLLKGNEFKVVGKGSVTVIDGSPMKLNDLPYRKKGERIGISGVHIDVLPPGYRYKIKQRQAVGPAMHRIVQAGGE